MRKRLFRCSTADQPTKTEPTASDGPTAPNWQRDLTSNRLLSIRRPWITCTITTLAPCTSKLRQTTGMFYWSHEAGAPFLQQLSNPECNPNITQEVTHATSEATTIGSYLRTWAITGPGLLRHVLTTQDMSRQDFWQCPRRRVFTIHVMLRPYTVMAALRSRWRTSRRIAIRRSSIGERYIRVDLRTEPHDKLGQAPPKQQIPGTGGPG